jgi:hypothetical protein
MESKGIRTCLTIGIGLIILVMVFGLGAGTGYFLPRLLPTPSPVSVPISCPPCPEVITSPTDETGHPDHHCAARMS